MNGSQLNIVQITIHGHWGVARDFQKQTYFCIGKETTHYQMKQWELKLADHSLTLHKSQFTGIGVLLVIYKTEIDLNNGNKTKKIYILVTKHK